MTYIAIKHNISQTIFLFDTLEKQVKKLVDEQKCESETNI